MEVATSSMSRQRSGRPTSGCGTSHITSSMPPGSAALRISWTAGCNATTHVHPGVIDSPWTPKINSIATEILHHRNAHHPRKYSSRTSRVLHRSNANTSADADPIETVAQISALQFCGSFTSCCRAAAGNAVELEESVPFLSDSVYRTLYNSLQQASSNMNLYASK